MRKTLLTLLKIVATVLVVWFLVSRLGFASILSTLRQTNPWWYIGGGFVFIISVFIGVVQWRMLLANRGIPLPFSKALRLYYVGLFFNNFVFGGIVGDATRVASIHLEEKKGRAGLAATFLDRFVGLLAMCGFAVAGSAVLLLTKGATQSGKIDTAIIALFVTFLCFAGIMALLISQRMQKLFFVLFDKVPFPQKQRIRDIITEILFEATDRNLLWIVLLLSTIIQFIRIGVHITCGISLGMVDVSNYQYFFIFVPILAMIMVIPLPLFVREAVGGALFALAGFDPHRAFVMSFLASLLGLFGSLPGALFFIIGKQSVRKLS